MNTIDRTLKYVDLYLVNNDLDNIKQSLKQGNIETLDKMIYNVLDN